MPNHRPIVVIDSGLGGLTVAAAIRRRLSGEPILYFGDTARVPYGNKSSQTVTAFLDEIIRYLHRFNPKHIVIACNTGTALALAELQRRFSHLSITGVIEPGVGAALSAVEQKASPRIGIIATEATVRSDAYQQSIRSARADATLLATPAPLLVPMLEEGRPLNDRLIRLALEEYLEPMITHRVDALVLGCTHYPILKSVIAEIMPAGTAIIDSARQCAEDVAIRLQSMQYGNLNGPSEFRCLVTDNTPKFAALAQRFLGMRIENPVWISAEELAQPTERNAIRLVG
ncbi:MAG TPA: glutamate racemase [Tepidisphaeraceae bacterium]|nr:glutamate racemase [Tepidisphaeraceae bacterium]